MDRTDAFEMVRYGRMTSGADGSHGMISMGFFPGGHCVPVRNCNWLEVDDFKFQITGLKKQ